MAAAVVGAAMLDGNYGIRVLGRPDTPPREVLNPFGVRTDEPDVRPAQSPERTP